VAKLSSYVTENDIPASMLKGETYTISVTMWNDGATDWTTADGFALRAVSPEGTGRWGISTVGLPGGQTVAAGGTVKFEFDVTAPSAPGLYACHWRMAKGSRYFGEVATGATKVRPDNDPFYGQESPAIGGDWAAYMDYGGLYRDYGVSAITVRHLPTGNTTTLPEDIPFPTDAELVPYPPYEYFDISWHYVPEISGSWVTWVVDDRLEPGGDPWDPYALWYYQVTAHNVQSAGVLPLRIVYDDWDALFPAIDGNLVVWEDYRNDPDRLWGWYDFLNDNADIYIYDIEAGESYPLCTAAGPQLTPRISGDLVVWEDWRDGMQSDIHLYDLSVDTDGDGTPNWKDGDRPDPDPAESMVTDTWWFEQYPDVSGRRVVWLDLRRDDGMGTTVDVYLRDLDGPTEAAVATDPAAVRLQPRIDGTQVTWSDWREGSWDVYWMNVATGAGGPIAGSIPNEFFSDISGDRVIYQKDRATLGEPPNEWYVYNVWVQEMLQEGSVGTHTFTDVPSTHWSWWEVEQAVENGVVQGYGDAYQPGWIVSRDQMAVFIARAMGWVNIEDDMNTAPQLFPDVPAGFWAGTAIQACVDQKVVEGYPGGDYQPSGVVTRDQMGVFIARAKGWVAIGDEMGTAPELFPDVLAGFWAGTAIEACVDNGVVSGYPDGYYHPEYACSRDQMAVYVSRTFGY
jgi:beta propeller repeat protein